MLRAALLLLMVGVASCANVTDRAQQCSPAVNGSYPGTDIGDAHDASTPDACCAICKELADAGCTCWKWKASSKRCYAKKDCASLQPESGQISGTMVASPPSPSPGPAPQPTLPPSPEPTPRCVPHGSTCTLRGAWLEVTIGIAVFNVTKYGAKGDGKTDDTKAIQRAFDAAAKAKGGTVFPPPGKTYASGPFKSSSSNTALELPLGAVIKFVSLLQPHGPPKKLPGSQSGDLIAIGEYLVAASSMAKASTFGRIITKKEVPVQGC
jgi:hypothetical protein